MPRDLPAVGVRRYRLLMRTVKGAAGLGVNVRLALAGLHNGSQGSRPRPALAGRQP